MSIDFQPDGGLDFQPNQTTPAGLDFKPDEGALIAQHVEAAKAVEDRTKGLNESIGIPHDDLSAKLDATAHAQQVVPLLPDQNALAQIVLKNQERFSQFKTPLEPLGNKRSFNPKGVLYPDPLLGMVDEKASAAEKAAFEKAKVEGEGVAQVSPADIVAESMGKSAIVAPVRSVEMMGRMARMVQEYTSGTVGLQVSLSKTPPEARAKAEQALGINTDDAIDSIKRFGDWLDQQGTVAMPLEQRQSFTTKMFSSLGALPMLLAGQGVLGRYGTAAYLALQNSQDVSSTAEQLALRDGHDAATAKHIGDLLGSASYPLSYVLNLWNPLARVDEAGATGNNLSTRVMHGGLQNYIVGKGQQIINGGFAPLASDPLHRDATAKQTYGYAINGADSQDAVNLLTGGIIGGITPPQKLELQDALKRLRVQPDVLNKTELLRAVRSQYAQPGGISDSSDSALTAAVDLLDAGVQHYVRQNGGTPEEAYGSLVGQLKESGELGGKSSLILSDRANRIFDALGKDDPRTAMAEMSWLFRDGFMSPEDRQKTEQLFGVKPPDAKQQELESQRQQLLDLRKNVTQEPQRSVLNALIGTFDQAQLQASPGSRWTPKQNESYARAFEGYLRTGIAPTPELQPLFDDTSAMLKQMVGKAQTFSFKLKGGDLSGILDRQFIADSDPVKAARVTLNEKELAYSAAKESVSEPPDIEEQLNLTKAKNDLDAARNDLAKAQAQNFNPVDPTRAELAALQAKTLINDIPADATKNIVIRGLKGAANHLMGFFGDASTILGNSPLAEALKGYMRNASIYKMQLAGQLNDSVHTALSLMSKQGAEELGQLDENGFSLARRLIEPSDRYQAASPQNQSQRAFMEMWRQIWKWSTNGMIENDFMRRLRSGNVVPADESPQMMMFRVGTQLAHDFASGRGGEMLKQYVDYVNRANPGANVTPDEMIRELQKPQFHLGTARQGSLEGARGDLVLPDGFFDQFGRQQNVFQSYPAELFHSTIDRIATRLALVRYMGQDAIENFAEGGERTINAWKSLTDLFGATPQYDRKSMIERLAQQGEDRIALGKMKNEELQALSYEHEIPTTLQLEDLMDIGSRLNAKTLGAEAIAKLRDLANEVGGINSQGADPQWVLEQLRHRLTFETQDKLMDVWRTRWAKEFGETERFDKFINSWNGLFGNDVMTLNGLRGIPAKAADILANAVGTPLTSLAQIKHVFQPLRSIEVLVRSGMNPVDAAKELLMAYGKGIFDPNGARQDLRPWKSVADWGWNQRSRTGSMLVDFFRNVRSAAARGTFMAPLMQLNESVAAHLGRGLADDWVNRSFGRESIGLAKSLGLNDAEIAMLMDRGVKVPLGRSEVATSLDQMAEMVKSGKAPEATSIIPLQPEQWSQLYEKIVRGTLARVQGGEWELPQNRSIVESNPWTRRLLGWQKWAATSLRQTMSLMTDIRSDDTAVRNAAGMRILAHLGATLGVGVLQHLLVNATKTVPPESDKDALDSMGGALAESYLFGTPMQLLSQLRFSNGDADKFVLGFMPQLAALTRLVQMIVGSGRFGGDTPLNRVGRTALDMTPIAKAMYSHWEQETYPQVTEWKASRQLYRQWEEKQPTAAPPASFDEPIDIHRWNVFVAVRRGDLESAQIAMKDYVQAEMTKDPTKKPSDVLESLRLSLEDRRPVPLTGVKLMKFYSTLTPEQRTRLLAAQQRYQAIANTLIPPKPKMTMSTLH